MRAFFLLAFLVSPLAAQSRDSLVLLKPAAVWDGTSDAPAAGWTVLVRGERIAAVGPADWAYPREPR